MQLRHPVFVAADKVRRNERHIEWALHSRDLRTVAMLRKQNEQIRKTHLEKYGVYIDK